MRLVEIGQAKEGGSPLTSLADDIERNEAPWKEYTALEAPEAAIMPSDLTAKLSLFEQLLVSPASHQGCSALAEEHGRCHYQSWSCTLLIMTLPCILHDIAVMLMFFRPALHHATCTHKSTVPQQACRH